MAKRRKYGKRSKFKVKLRKNTIYSIFSFGQLLLGGLLFLSFTQSGPTLSFLNAALVRFFGQTSFLVPFAFIFFGLLFMRLKFFLARPNVSLGFLIFVLSIAALAKTGVIGFSLFINVADVISPIGATLVFLAGLIIGLIVFFDTSVDELAAIMSGFANTFSRLIPKSLFSYFKNKPKQPELKIKGEINKFPSVVNKSPVMSAQQKEDGIISEKLVSNTMSSGLIWEYPPLSLLSESSEQKADRGDIKKIATTIENTLKSFGISANVVEVNLGPSVTQYAIQLSEGTKISKITALSNDLALATEAPTGQIRLEAPIPGRNLVGIEIPNKSLEVVSLRTMLASDNMRKSKSKLTVSMGLDVSGTPLVADIGRMPHVLIAGTTGSGKSVMINSIITSLLFRASPEEVKLILVDPKRVELTGYNGVPHLMVPVIVEVEKILSALKWAMNEMDRRYKTFAERGVRNIEGYNEQAGFQALPYIVIVIDELADLMAFAPVEVEDAIARLAQMARATGIHLIVSTQRPSVDVITGLIKANIPTRIAFNVSSMIDSRVILDSPGAEKLLGRGDMLYIPPDQAKPTRIQGAFVSEKDVKRLVDFLKEKAPEVEYTQEIVETPFERKGAGGVMGNTGQDGHDALFLEAVKVVCDYDKASASLLQRRLSIGYSRAARIIDQLEAEGIVGHADGSKPRDVLLTDPSQYLESLQQQQ